jgi:predicted ArsR family transcriptional regulator
MIDEDKRDAMCAEIAQAIGVRYRKPGQVTVKEYSESVGLSTAAGKRHLEKLVREGTLVRENVIDNGHWCIVYGKADGVTSL